MKNGTDQPVKGKLKGQIEAVSFEQDVELAPNEVKDVTFTPDQMKTWTDTRAYANSPWSPPYTIPGTSPDRRRRRASHRARP